MGKVVTRTYEYDAAGRIVKETETVTETGDSFRPYIQPVWVQPQPYRYYPHVTYSGSVSGAGGGGAGGSVTYFNSTAAGNTGRKPDDPDMGVTAKV